MSSALDQPPAGRAMPCCCCWRPGRLPSHSCTHIPCSPAATGHKAVAQHFFQCALHGTSSGAKGHAHDMQLHAKRPNTGAPRPPVPTVTGVAVSRRPLHAPLAAPRNQPTVHPGQLSKHVPHACRGVLGAPLLPTGMQSPPTAMSGTTGAVNQKSHSAGWPAKQADRSPARVMCVSRAPGARIRSSAHGPPLPKWVQAGGLAARPRRCRRH